MFGDSHTTELILTLVEFGQVWNKELQEHVSPRIVENADLIVLMELALEGPKRPTELRQRTRLSSGGMSKLVDRLEEAGLVSRDRRPIDNDKRAVVIELTEEGVKQVDLLTAATMVILNSEPELIKGIRRLLEAIG
jgi:DNA-binding MarR family transcriptional regulator